MTALLTAPGRTRPRPLLDLAAHGNRTAIRTATGTTSYAELAERVDDLAGSVLGQTRRLVLVEAANRIDAVTAYLAALQHGHVALLVPERPEGQRREDQWHEVVETYDPDVVLHQGAAGWEATQRREGAAHDLHPDLALLLSTSGSTGSPKLVRLSHENVRSNALSIASYLGLTPADRAATSLPIHYCYGLSVVNSHLATGAGLVLTDHSVVDECFWDLFDDAGATSFAGVPYTFDLLDRSGFEKRSLPTLRYVTQAGGRLAPDRVRRYAELGRRQGWDLVVMYGQTEATARMAHLPPRLAATHPQAIGIPIPGGSFRLEPVPEDTDPGIGELVYSGPNVMMGYAERPVDLAAGTTTTELRTGDLARVSDGLYEVVGRRSQHAKLFGLRIDLDRVERCAATAGPVRCVVVDDVLHAFTTRRRIAPVLQDRIAAFCGLPTVAVRVSVLPELPLTASGKPDHRSLEAHARLLQHRSRHEQETAAAQALTPEAVRDEYAVVLGRPDADLQSTFVGLGGDSLSYVELATRLSHRLGDLPADWHTRTVGDLATTARRRRHGVSVDATVLLRALAILAIVGTHANLLTIVGGAHVLLAVAGFNFARFQLADVPRRMRIRNGLVAVAQVAVPSALFIGVVAAGTGFYDPATAVFLNGLVGSDTWTDQWQFWFLEAVVWIWLGVVGLMAVPAVDRLERRAPYGFALGLLGAALCVRYVWVGVEAGPTERYTVAVVAWAFVLGWLAARARTWPLKVAVLLAAAVTVAGFFGDTGRELLVLVGVATLTWVPAVRLPRLVASVLGVLASASLFVYLTHWQVYPHLEMDYPLLATLASFAVGIAYWWLMRPVVRWMGRALRSRRTGSATVARGMASH